MTYGDGSAFDDADVQAAVEIAYDLVFDLRESGDVALIDNYRGYARSAAFLGPAKRVPPCAWTRHLLNAHRLVARVTH